MSTTRRLLSIFVVFCLIFTQTAQAYSLAWLPHQYRHSIAQGQRIASTTGDVNISAATNTYGSDSYSRERTTGLQIKDAFNISDAGPEIISKAHTDGSKQSLSRSSFSSNSGNLSILSGGNIVATGTDLAANAGELALNAAGSVVLYAGQDTFNQSSSTQVITSPNAFTKLRHTVTDTSASLDYLGSTVQGKSVKINSGGDIVLQATDVKAGEGGIALDAGRDIKLLAAANQSSHTHTETLSTDGYAFRADGSLNDTATRRMNNKNENQTQTNQVVSLVSGGNISTHSGGDTLIQASTLDAKGSIDLSATGYAATTNADGSKNEGRDGKITFAAIKDSTYTNTANSSNSMPWQGSSGHGDYNESLKLANISAGKGLTVDAKGGIVVDIPVVAATPAPAPRRDASGKLIPVVPLTPEQQAAQQQADLEKHLQNLANQPGQAWIGQLAKDPKIQVQWKQTQAAIQHWDYAHEGLTTEATIVIAIVVTYCSAGIAGGAADSMVAGAGMTGATATVASAAIAAGLTTIASESTIALINNKGDIGKTMDDMGKSENVRNVIAAMLTAGVTAGYGNAYSAEGFVVKTLTGCVTGDLTGSGCEKGATTAAIMAGSAWANHAMRTSMINDSNKFLGVTDTNDPSGTNYNNATGQGSVGIDGDGQRLAGTRISEKGLKDFGTVTEVTPGTWAFTGNINPATGQPYSLTEALTAQGGLTGGTQALLPTFAGMPVTPGSFLDKLDESFAGPHDYMGGSIQGGYNNSGNWGVASNTADYIRGVMAGVNIPLVIPLVIPTLLQQIHIDPVVLNNTVHNSGSH